jgi:hypothetical protein
MAFDRLVDQARQQLYGTAPPARPAGERGVLGTGCTGSAQAALLLVVQSGSVRETG